MARACPVQPPGYSNTTTLAYWALGFSAGPRHPCEEAGNEKRLDAALGCAPPALVNAVVGTFEAFGDRHIDMPLTPERVWRAIHAQMPS